LSCGNHCQLGETNVVADGNSNLSILWQIDQSNLVSRTQNLALLESNLARNINVEQVDLSVCFQEASVWTEDETCVVVLIRIGEVFGNATTNEVGFGLFGQSGQGVEGGRL
jgi:hypothetical protein